MFFLMSKYVSTFLRTNLVNYFFSPNYSKNYSHLPNTIEIKDDDSKEISTLIFRDSDEKKTFTIKKKNFYVHENLKNNVYNDSEMVN